MMELLIRAGLLVAVAATGYHILKVAHKTKRNQSDEYYGGKPANKNGKLTMDDDELFW